MAWKIQDDPHLVEHLSEKGGIGDSDICSLHGSLVFVIRFCASDMHMFHETGGSCDFVFGKKLGGLTAGGGGVVGAGRAGAALFPRRVIIQ